MNDIYVSTTMIVLLIGQLVTFAIGYKMQKTTLLISHLNAVIVIGLFIFWTINTLAPHKFGVIF